MSLLFDNLMLATGSPPSVTILLVAAAFATGFALRRGDDSQS